MKILSNGIAVLENDAWASAWVEQLGTLQYDACIEEFLKPLLKPGDTAIDIGAYIGGYAGPFKQFVGASGKVYAFEPNPEPFECLVRNCPGVVCHQVALGKQDGVSQYFTDTINRGASFILPQNNTNQISKPVEIKTLDSFGIERPKLIKIDVEGMEIEVIQGGIETIKSSFPVIYLELNHGAIKRAGYNFNHLINYMKLLGYRMEFTSNEHNLNEAQWPQLDVFFKHGK